MFGLDRDFTRADLEQAYRDLVQVWHPDRYSYNPRLRHKAEETLKEINSGYDLLREKIVKSDARTVREDTPESSAHPHRERGYPGHIKQELHDKSTGYRKRSSLVSLGNIFHPTDFSKASEIAFCHALKLSVITGAQLSILHITPSEGDVHFREFPEVRHTLERWGILPRGSSKEDVIKKAGIFVEKIVKVHEDTVHSILHFLEHSPTDLIVLAAHQSKEPVGWLKRSVAMPIALGSGEMTLFVPEGIDGLVSVRDGTINLKRVLIPIDNHPSPQLAVNAACVLADAFGAADCLFVLVHVGDFDHMPAVNIPTKDGWQWKKITRPGEVVKEILHLGTEYSADLIVMTTHGHEGFLDAFRGNTTERVLRGARCPLLAIPALRKRKLGG
jgi:nucleotide-binding universal stress UspA family protein